MDFEAAKKLKVLVVGDGIVDEYVYVHPIGKAVKENCLSASRIWGEQEIFYGGAWAAQAHVKGFCDRVDRRIGPELLVNSRLVDKTYYRKLFVTHEARPSTERLAHGPIGSYDLVIVCDFGHGALHPELIKQICNEGAFVAVNAQTNSMNYGFNMITKYPKVDFVVIDELEARLATHDRTSSIEDVIAELGFPNIIVTLGAEGAVGWDGKDFYRAPAVVDHAVDTMGAGDAFLCVTAPFAALGVPMHQLLRIGNAAGAAKVGIVGHRASVTRDLLEKYL